ncbi:MAG TPA: hypothetical protein VFV50_02255, partial [Bdellovibrionales bacterium]|nr:hypothetical protein [Bdellovibrionales bacterium]
MSNVTKTAARFGLFIILLSFQTATAQSLGVTLWTHQKLPIHRGQVIDPQSTVELGVTYSWWQHQITVKVDGQTQPPIIVFSRSKPDIEARIMKAKRLIEFAKQANIQFSLSDKVFK